MLVPKECVLRGLRLGRESRRVLHVLVSLESLSSCELLEEISTGTTTARQFANRRGQDVNLTGRFLQAHPRFVSSVGCIVHMDGFTLPQPFRVLVEDTEGRHDA